MTLSTSTVTLAPGSSRTYSLAPGEAVTVATEPNCYVTVTETPEVITTADQGGQTNVRTSILQYKGEWTYGPYALGGTVVVAVSLAKSTSSASVTLGSAAAAVVGAAGFKIGAPVVAPISNLTAAVGAAGSLTGTYGYTVTFVLDDGAETEPWPGTATTVSPSSRQVNLTSIPVSSSASVSARRIYRTVASAVDPKDYYFLAEIPNNTTTTYTDNIADGSLGSPVKWLGTASGTITNEAGRVAAGLGPQQSVAIGDGSNAGYATTAIGFEAGRDITSGRRNTLVGTYAGAALTTGYENSTYGVHAGDSLTTGVGNTFIGFDSGSNTITKNFNVAVGNQAMNATGETGSGNVAVGYRALGNINTADQCLGLGYFAGRYANASRQVFIDVADRTNIANAQNIGLIYGKGEATAIAQVLHLNAPTRIGPPSVTVATLPAAAAGYTGFRAFVTDANATTFASIVAGGGSNGVPVYCDGTNWRIG